jgi:hypothetical protein
MEESPLRMSDVVCFELPRHADVDEFCARIRTRWSVSKEPGDDAWVVSACVRKRKNDLALLLREVETYVTDTNLQAIRYHVDGRFYIMEAAPLDRAASF